MLDIENGQNCGQNRTSFATNIVMICHDARLCRLRNTLHQWHLARYTAETAGGCPLGLAPLAPGSFRGIDGVPKESCSSSKLSLTSGPGENDQPEAVVCTHISTHEWVVLC